MNLEMPDHLQPRDYLSLLPAELLEILLRDLSPRTAITLSCTSRQLRNKMSPMEWLWQGICRQLGILKEDKAATWRETYLETVERVARVVAAAEQQGQARTVTRCLKDISQPDLVDCTKCSLFNLVPASSSSASSCMPPREAGEIQAAHTFHCSQLKASGSSSSYAVDPKLVHERDMGYAYNDHYFVASHSSRSVTHLTAWDLKQASSSAAETHMGPVSQGTIAYGLPTQNVALWRHFLVYVPYIYSDNLLEAADVKCNFAPSGSIFDEADEIRQDSEVASISCRYARGMHFANLSRDDVAHCIFVHGDRVLFTDAPRYTSSTSRWCINLVDLVESDGNNAAQGLEMKIAQRTFVNGAYSHVFMENFASSQRGPMVALGYHLHGPHTMVAACNMETGTIRVFYPDQLFPNIPGFKELTEEDDRGNPTLVLEDDNGAQLLEVPSAWHSLALAHVSYPCLKSEERLGHLEGPAKVPEVLLMTIHARVVKVGDKVVASAPLPVLGDNVDGGPPSYHEQMHCAAPRDELVVMPGSDIVVAKLQLPQSGRYHLSALRLDTLEPVWNMPLEPFLTMQKPLMAATPGLVWIFDTSGARIIDQHGKLRGKLELPPTQLHCAFKTSWTEENSPVVSKWKAHPWYMQWEASPVCGNRKMMVVHALDRSAPLVFDLLDLTD